MSAVLALPAGTAVAPTRWRIGASEPGIASADRTALGTSARVVVWPPGELGAATRALDAVLSGLDLEASRFRPDSELSRIERAGGGLFFVSVGLAEALEVAIAAARWTHGLVDPTVGGALATLGYDRDFAEIGADLPGHVKPVPVPVPVPVPGWRSITLEGRLLRRGPDVHVDLGATAKGLGSDRGVNAVRDATGGLGGVLVNLGGDLAVGGEPPCGGWPIRVHDDVAGVAGNQVVRLLAGAVATSSVATRRWRREGHDLHHLLDPATGMPARGPWRTASVAARTCAEANAAATAALVAGEGGRAERWLSSTGLPARLVAHDGRVVLLGGWPARDGGSIDLSRARRGPVSLAQSRTLR